MRNIYEPKWLHIKLMCTNLGYSQGGGLFIREGPLIFDGALIPESTNPHRHNPDVWLFLPREVTARIGGYGQKRRRSVTAHPRRGLSAYHGFATLKVVRFLTTPPAAGVDMPRAFRCASSS